MVPKNGVASGCAAEVLWRLVRLNVDDREQLRRLAMHYGRHSNDNAATVLKHGGKHALESFRRLPVTEDQEFRLTGSEELGAYETFSVRHRLVLVPFVEIAVMDRTLWDSLVIAHFTEPHDTPSSPPPVFAMFNSLKEEFLLRGTWLLPRLRDDFLNRVNTWIRWTTRIWD